MSAAAVRVQPAFERPAEVLELTRRAGPYLPLSRQARSEAERRAAGAGGGSAFVPPWFRRDLVTFGEVHVEGAESILHNRAFADAARSVFGGDVLVRPTTVYVNVMAPGDVPFIAHTDVPVFRGASRRDTPVWLLSLMHASGLFDAERVRLATAVTWFFDGPGGDFHYWPDGPDAAPMVEPAPFRNVAVVADNERTYHGVAPVGVAATSPPVALTLGAECEHDPAAAAWLVHDRGEIVARYPEAVVRTTISWKAEIHADAAAALAEDEAQALTPESIVDRLQADLEASGRPAVTPSDPFDDPVWIEVLNAAYPQHAPRIL